MTAPGGGAGFELLVRLEEERLPCLLADLEAETAMYGIAEELAATEEEAIGGRTRAWAGVADTTDGRQTIVVGGITAAIV